MTGQERGKVLRHSNGTDTRTAAAMRNAEGLVQVEMADVGSERSRPAEPHLGVEIGAIEINLPAMAMHHGTDLTDPWLKDAVRGGIGHHQSRQTVAELLSPGRQIIQIDVPVVVTGHSLGGALATLAAFELAASGYETSVTSVTSVTRDTDGVEKSLPPPPPPPPPRARAFVAGVRTFGSPRVGDILFAAAYRAVLGDRTWRVTHAHDVVPSVPVRLMGFHHVPTEVFYADGVPRGRGGGNETAPVVCDGGGEDPACSDGEWTHTSVMDHLYYLDTYICGCNI